MPNPNIKNNRLIKEKSQYT